MIYLFVCCCRITWNNQYNLHNLDRGFSWLVGTPRIPQWSGEERGAAHAAAGSANKNMVVAGQHKRGRK